MLDALFTGRGFDSLFTGWGAFWMTLFMFVPFALLFWYIVYRKSFVVTSPIAVRRESFSRVETVWLATVFAVFLGVNLASINFMPLVAAARIASTGEPVREIDITAKSWAYDISNRQIEAGRPVRFSGRSSDTQHGFAVYHPDGRLLFTMILMPGLNTPTTVVHTFTEPGKYKVRCLEYCGIAHHLMQDDLVVVKSSN